MFNLDTNAMAAQFAAKSEAEKRALQKHAVQLNGTRFSGTVISDMVTDPDISTQSFIAFLMMFYL